MNSKKRPILLLTCGILLIAAFLWAGQSLRADSAPEQFLDVWERVRQSGAYRFNSDVKQTLTPLPSPLNAGRQPKETRLHMDGRADLRAETMQLNMWTGGGSVMLPESSYQLKVQDNQAYIRQGAGDWQETENFTGIVAPDGDMMGYLNAADNIVRLEPQLVSTAVGELVVTKFTFDINGRRFAEFMRDRLQQQGGIPPGTASRQIQPDGKGRRSVPCFSCR